MNTPALIPAYATNPALLIPARIDFSKADACFFVTHKKKVQSLNILIFADQ
jgi:hypothetical protein